jgi:crossover junction endodeoxyribonuclease RusA
MTILVLPYPPSMNGYWRSLRTGRMAGRVLISERGRAFRKDVEAAARLQEIARLEGPLKVTLWLHPPDRRRRDIDNPIKPLLDALTHAGAWSDDSQIRELRVTMEAPDKDNPRTLVLIDRVAG